jgi:hypothetical protein
LGVPYFTSDSIRIYNNLVEDNLNIDLFLKKGGDNITFTVYDMLGKKVLEETKSFPMDLSATHLDLRLLPFGTYILKVDGDKISYKGKFVKVD